MDCIVHRLSTDVIDKNSRLKLLTGAVVVAILTLGMVVGSAASARADTTPAPTPSPAPTSDLTTPTPPTPPDPTQTPAAPITIDSPSEGSFIGSGRATVSGTKAEGDRIQLFAGSPGGTPLCVADEPGTSWSCSDIALPNGAHVTLDAVVAGDSSRSASTTIAVLGPPTVTASNGRVLSNGLVHGTAFPGARVTASVSGGARCSFTADSSGRWACILSDGMRDGHYTVSASQRGPSGFPAGTSDSSDAVAFELDTTAPSVPIVSAPVSGTHLRSGVSTTYSGVGEDGAKVTVWAGSRSGSSRLCTAQVTGGTWSCVGGPLPPGRYVVSALQEDAAGNTSAASVGLSLRYATPPVPAPSSPPSESASPPGDSSTPTHPPSSPDTGSPAPTAPKGPGGTVPPSDGFVPHLTPLTAAVQPVAQLGTLFDWMRAGILALVALALLAIPARMLAGTVATARAGSHTSGWRLFGRNHAKAEFDEAPDVHAPAPWIVPAAGLLAATALVTLSSPVDDQIAYLRMSVAVLAALAIVGAIAIVAPRLAARRLAGVGVATAFAPYTLLLVAAASVVSRALELQPALMYGVIAMVTVTTGTAAARGKIAAITVGSLAALAAVGWLVIGILPAPNTVVTAFTAELVNAVVLVAIGSAAVLMLPLASLPGRVILRWSWGIWLAAAVAVDTVLFAILVPIGRLSTSGTGTVLFAVCTIGFAAISVSVWLWQRYIAPALR